MIRRWPVEIREGVARIRASGVSPLLILGWPRLTAGHPFIISVRISELFIRVAHHPIHHPLSPSAQQNFVLATTAPNRRRRSGRMVTPMLLLYVHFSGYNSIENATIVFTAHTLGI
ncbi:hypothetical protein DMENIID0001_145490 [Sergentomyia squamirostris]